MNDSILARTGWLAALGHAVLIPASAWAQSANAQRGARSEATIRIRVSVAPRFMTSSRASADAAGAAINVTSNAPGLQYEVVTQPPDMDVEGGDGQIRTGRTQPARSSMLLLIVPD